MNFQLLLEVKNLLSSTFSRRGVVHVKWWFLIQNNIYTYISQAPIYHELAKKYTGAIFCQVDVDRQKVWFVRHCRLTWSVTCNEMWNKSNAYFSILQEGKEDWRIARSRSWSCKELSSLLILVAWNLYQEKCGYIQCIYWQWKNTWWIRNQSWTNLCCKLTVLSELLMI